MQIGLIDDNELQFVAALAEEKKQVCSPRKVNGVFWVVGEAQPRPSGKDRRPLTVRGTAGRGLLRDQGTTAWGVQEHLTPAQQRAAALPILERDDCAVDSFIVRRAWRRHVRPAPLAGPLRRCFRES